MHAFAKSIPVAAVAVSLALLVCPTAPPADASDFGDGPTARSSGALDLGDLYVFTSPQNPDHTVFVVTASPFAGWLGPESFATKSTYTVSADLTNDRVEDDVHTFSFGAPAADGTQSVTVSHRGRGGKFKSKGKTGQPFSVANGTRIQCGLFDDPAFIDLRGLRASNTYSDTGSTNLFKGANVLAIVIDVSNGEFGPNSGLKVWATSSRGRTQIDRVGRPMISALTILPGRKDAYNRSKVKNDFAEFHQDVANRIATLRGGNFSGVDALVTTLLPDAIPFTLGDTNGMSQGNGRKLDDDAVDIQLTLLTANAVPTDYVANDSAFLASFPFLAPAN